MLFLMPNQQCQSTEGISIGQFTVCKQPLLLYCCYFLMVSITVRKCQCMQNQAHHEDMVWLCDTHSATPVIHRCIWVSQLLSWSNVPASASLGLIKIFHVLNINTRNYIFTYWVLWYSAALYISLTTAHHTPWPAISTITVSLVAVNLY